MSSSSREPEYTKVEVGVVECFGHGDLVAYVRRQVAETNHPVTPINKISMADYVVDRSTNTVIKCRSHFEQIFDDLLDIKK